MNNNKFIVRECAEFKNLAHSFICNSIDEAIILYKQISNSEGAYIPGIFFYSQKEDWEYEIFSGDSISSGIEYYPKEILKEPSFQDALEKLKYLELDKKKMEK